MINWCIDTRSFSRWRFHKRCEELCSVIVRLFLYLGPLSVGLHLCTIVLTNTLVYIFLILKNQYFLKLSMKKGWGITKRNTMRNGKKGGLLGKLDLPTYFYLMSRVEFTIAFRMPN